jgi:flavin-dependent dehydrogenase
MLSAPARAIPVLGEFDVVVCGGGAAGCAAAIAAARHGARTLPIEKDGFLGGATVSQLVGHHKDHWPYEHKYWQDKGWL